MHSQSLCFKNQESSWFLQFLSSGVRVGLSFFQLLNNRHLKVHFPQYEKNGLVLLLKTEFFLSIRTHEVEWHLFGRKLDYKLQIWICLRKVNYLRQRLKAIVMSDPFSFASPLSMILFIFKTNVNEILAMV